jgi:hypothetical protein
MIAHAPKRPDEDEPAKPITGDEQPSKVKAEYQYLVYARDADDAPAPLVPDGPFLERLYLLVSSNGPAALDFTQDQVMALVHIAPLLIKKPYVIVSEGMKMLIGRDLLLKAYEPLATDVAKKRVEDELHESMRMSQAPGERLRRQLKKVGDEFNNPPIETDKKKLVEGDVDESSGGENEAN